MVWYIYVISFYFSSFYLSTCYQQVNLKNFLYICCVPKVLSKFFKFCMSELQHIPVLQPLESPLSFTAPGNSSIRTQRVLLFTYTAQYLDKDQKNPTTGFLSSLSSALFSLVPCHTKCTHFSILNSSLFFSSIRWGSYTSFGFHFPMLQFGKYPAGNWQCIIFFFHGSQPCTIIRCLKTDKIDEASYFIVVYRGRISVISIIPSWLKPVHWIDFSDGNFLIFFLQAN